MVSPLVALTPKVQSAIAAALGDDYREADPVLRPSQFADVQVNAALALAKKVGMPPREVAAKIVDALDLDGVCDAVEVSGPGFINLTFSDAWLAGSCRTSAADERAGVPLQRPQNIPIDYSAPNVAKEMHVGHLRTTVVGDSLARTLEHLGHNVIRQNHIGDWGTPFGMLIEHLLDVGEGSAEAELLVTDPNAFYQAARVKFDPAEKAEPAGSAGDFNAARAHAGRLAAGRRPRHPRGSGRSSSTSPRPTSTRSTRPSAITLTDLDLAGESTYNDALPGHSATSSRPRGIATMSDGALCVFLDGYTGREGKPVPLIIRKSDGGYGYATTDLATIRYRVHDLKAHRVLYVIGAPQALHLNMVWDTARKAGWLPDDVVPVHVQIGNVLGEDRKILKTRSGKPLRLMALLDEAVEKARTVIDEARPDLDDERPGDHRPPDRHRGREVRRPVRRARQRVRLRPRPHGRADRQHRPLPAVRRRAHPLDLPPGRGGPGRPARADPRRRAAGARPAPCTCSASATSWPRSATSTSRTGCAPTSSSWPSRSRRSTRTARCSRPSSDARQASRASRSARSSSAS